MHVNCPAVCAKSSVRIKDIAQIEGVRSNHLFGYGLVFGLDGTGDSGSSDFTVQSIASMLRRMGITIPASSITVDNVAAVMVTAELPAFAKEGTKIDVIVSSIGDCESLFGGTLLMTPLQGVDGNIYAVAQGPVSLGGFAFGAGGASAVKNVPTTATIPNGAMVEKEVPSTMVRHQTLRISLREPDFTTMKRMTDAINNTFMDTATSIDAATVSVAIPREYIMEEKVVDFIAQVETIELETDSPAKIIINERTGTIVAGSNVRITTVAVSHGNLNVVIKNNPVISQPNPFAEGDTVVTTDDELEVKEENNPLVVVEDGVTIGEVTRALNALGATPRDLIAIFQAMKRAGAINAELIIM
jgi:flagellar P-ring protein precursor FlgI